MVLDAFARGADGRVAAAWFPTRALPVRADYLSRLAWQFQTRAGADAFVRVPAGDLHAALGDAAPAALADLGAHVPYAGVLLDDRLPALAALPAEGGSETWEVQRARAATDAARLPEAERRALEAFRVLERARPRARLAMFSPDGALRASGIADITFVATTTARGEAGRVGAAYTPARPMAKPDSRRVGLWFTDAAPPDAAVLADETRAFQVRGGTAVGWCPDDPRADQPEAAAAAPGVSSATFPLRR